MSAFSKIAKEMSIDINAELFFAKAVNYSIVTNSKNTRIVGNDTATLFNQVLCACRHELKHVCGIIQKQDSAYLTMIEISVLAKNFCDINQLTYLEGFKIYCNIGLSLMKQYSIGKFKYHNEKINTIYQESQKIKKDKSPEATKAIRNYYFSKLKIEPIKTKDYHFILIKELVESLQVEYKEWIDYQFSTLSFIDMPEPYLFYGDKAVERWNSRTKSIKPNFTGVVDTRRKGLK